MDEAHDLVQDTWRRAYQTRASFTGAGTLIGWLLAVSRSVCRSALEKRRSREGLPVEGGVLMGRPSPTPDQATEQAEIRRSVAAALMELPPRQRDVVILRMLEQRSTREAAQILKCAEGTVKAALHHALKKLESHLEVWTR